MDASNAVQFGSVLREARRRQGLSQAELGGGKYSGSYISHLESGRRTASPEVVEFLSRRLGMSLLEWGLAPAPNPAFLGGTFEDLLVAERARSEHDWAAAITHATQAAASAEAAADGGRHWEAMYVVAQGRFASGEFAEAARLADALSTHEIAQQFLVARAQALSLASIANRASDHLGWAIAFGARAVEAASAAPPIILAEALMSLVSAMSEAGHAPEESQPYLDRLAALSPRLTSDHSRGMIAWTMSGAAFVAGDIGEGLRLQAQAGDLLDPRRDLRLWLRFHSTAARWRLGAGITDGVADLLQTASLGLQILGNNYDVVELRQSEAKLALLTGDATGGYATIRAILDDPVLGGPEMSRGQSELVLAECLEALGELEEARHQFVTAALQLEVEGRLRQAIDAWRRSVGEEVSGDFLTHT
nr:helix-turn-helix transcriptional regulator [Propionicimonas sp.]